MSDTEIRATLNTLQNDIDIVIRQSDAFVTDLTFTKINKGLHVSPQLSITREAAQNLMNDLWSTGIRPTIDYEDKKAINLHLQDMRRLVFELLHNTIEDKK